MKNKHHDILCVVLSLLQTALGVFSAFFGFNLILGVSQTNLNNCVSDALAKSFFVWLGILLSWFIGQKKMKKEDESTYVSFASKNSRNMMISSVVTTIFCWLLWISTRQRYGEMKGSGTQNILLYVAILSVVLAVVIIVLHYKLKRKQ